MPQVKKNISRDCGNGCNIAPDPISRGPIPGAIYPEVDGMKLVIIDGYPVAQLGMSVIIRQQSDMELVGIASSAAEGLRLLEDKQPHIALVDIGLALESHFSFIRQGRRVAPSCYFIILCLRGADDLRRMTAVDVEGLVIWKARPHEIVGAIRRVARGGRHICPALVQVEKEEKDVLSRLTARELEVLSGIARGQSNREIAGSLYVSENTVKKHIGRILSKLKLDSRTQAALYAASQGLDKPFRGDA